MTKFPWVVIAVVVLNCLSTGQLPAEDAAALRHRASLKVVEVGADGVARVLAAPELLFAADKAGQIEVQEEEGKTVRIKLTAVPRSVPTQYLAEFTLAEGKKVLSTPKIVTLTGQEGMITIGEEDGSRTEFSVIAREMFD